MADPPAEDLIGVRGTARGAFRSAESPGIQSAVILRYYPENPFPPALESVAFGLGLSTTTQDPRTEIDGDGETNKTLVY